MKNFWQNWLFFMFIYSGFVRDSLVPPIFSYQLIMGQYKIGLQATELINCLFRIMESHVNESFLDSLLVRNE